MNILIKELENLKKFKEYVSDINKKISPIVLSGLSSVGKIQLLEATKEFADRNICIVTYNELQAKKIYKDLKYFSGNVVYFPKREIASYDYVAESKDLPYERIETLNTIFELVLLLIDVLGATFKLFIPYPAVKIFLWFDAAFTL